MRRIKHIPKRLRETKAERRRRRDYERQHPEVAGLSGLLWNERIVKLKRRRRWAKRVDDRHIRTMPMTTGTIGGRSRALDVLTFNEDRTEEMRRMDLLFYRSVSLPTDMIVLNHA